LPAEVGDKIGQMPKLENYDNIYDRKMIKWIDGSERLEEKWEWAKRIYNIHIENNIEQQKLRGQGLRLINATYGLFVESAANALLHGADKNDILTAIGQNKYFPGYLQACGVYEVGTNQPKNILSDAEKLIKNRLQGIRDSGRLQNLNKIDLGKSTISAIFDAMSDAQKAEVIRNITTNPLISGPVAHTGPQRGPTIPNQFPRSNGGPSRIIIRGR
jgi:hypothetical protein